MEMVRRGGEKGRLKETKVGGKTFLESISPLTERNASRCGVWQSGNEMSPNVELNYRSKKNFWVGLMVAFE